MRSIHTALGAATITPELLTYVEKLQYEGYLRRQETDASIMKLSAAGVPIKEIVRRTGHSRKLSGRLYGASAVMSSASARVPSTSGCPSSTNSG